MIKDIIDTVSLPVMAKVRIGHFVEAQILQAIGVDYIDESEVLTMADDKVSRDSREKGHARPCWLITIWWWVVIASRLASHPQGPVQHPLHLRS